jgi:hypothetical protein
MVIEVSLLVSFAEVVPGTMREDTLTALYLTLTCEMRAVVLDTSAAHSHACNGKRVLPEEEFRVFLRDWRS